MTTPALPLGVGEAPWYSASRGQVAGPFSWAQLRERAASGQLSPDDLVCQEGQPEWLRAASVSGLFPSSGSYQATSPLAAGDTPAPPPSLSPAPVIPGYEIQVEVGRGGMGVVYKARQLSLGRTVALKMLLGADQAGPGLRERFQREARALARAQYPGIVQIYDVGEHQGQSYLALQFIDGASLKDHLRGNPLPAVEAAALVERLARVIHAAHEAGIVHRDLKPGNVLIDRQGQPHITDFGLAKDLVAETQHTVGNPVMGTPAYMAPEQAMGDSRSISPRTDVYALGAILYELLTGAPPFVGPAHVIVYNVIERTPQAPLRINPRIPKKLDQLCMRCLSKKPSQRPATALELAEQLRAFADSQTTLPPPTEVPAGLKPSPPVGQRNRRWVAALAVAGVLLLGWLLWSSERARRLSEENRDGLARQLEQVEGLLRREQQRTQEAERQRALALYRQVLADAQQDTTDSKLERARQRLPQAPADLRGWEWHHLDALATPPQLLSLAAHAGGAQSVAISPDGTLLASGGADNMIRLWDLATGKELKALSGHSGTVTGVAFSRDGKLLLSSSRDKTVRVWDVANGTVRTTYYGHSYEALSAAFDQDARRAVSSDTYGNVQVWDTTSGVTQTTLESSTYTSSNCVAWSGDGKRIAWSSGSNNVKVWDITAGRLLQTLTGHNSTVYGVAFNPDGQRLATCSNDNSTRLWEVETGKELLALKLPSSAMTGVAWSPDGLFVFTGSSDNTVRQWDAQTGKEHAACRRYAPGSVPSLAVHPQGNRLAAACSDRSVVVWDTRVRPARNWIYAHGDSVQAVAFSGDGKRFVSAGKDRTIRVWETVAGAELTQIKHGFLSPLCVAISTDGQAVAAGMTRTVTVWNASDGKTLHSLRKHKGEVLALAFLPDGKQLLSASRDGTVQAWDLTTGQPGLTIEAHKGGVYALAVSPDGRVLATGGADRVVRLWDPATGNELRTLSGHLESIQALAFTSDGGRLASQDADGSVKVWETAGGKELWSLRPPTPPEPGNRGLAFSLDGRRLLVAGANQVRILDVDTGEVVLPMRLEVNPIQGLAFSADGRHVAVAGGTVVVVLQSN